MLVIEAEFLLGSVEEGRILRLFWRYALLMGRIWMDVFVDTMAQRVGRALLKARVARLLDSHTTTRQSSILLVEDFGLWRLEKAVSLRGLLPVPRNIVICLWRRCLNNDLGVQIGYTLLETTGLARFGNQYRHDLT